MTVWTDGKQIEHRFYEVDPSTWRDRRAFSLVTDCSITRDASAELLGGAKMQVGEPVDREFYIREYLVATQGGVSERVCLGTHLAQNSRSDADGKVIWRPLSCYSPLQELRDSPLPTFAQAAAGSDPVARAAAICRAGCRAPVMWSGASGASLPDTLTAERGDDPLSFARKLLASAGMEIAVDEWGRISFEPIRPTSSLSPSWMYRDDEVSILFPDASEEVRWSELPNAMELTMPCGTGQLVGRARNEDADSPISTVRRGRVKVAREDGDALPAGSTQEQADARALERLKALSCDTRTIIYRHGYCPVRLGDGVLFDYTRHEWTARLRVVRQVIECGSSSCTVTETGAGSEILWR